MLRWGCAVVGLLTVSLLHACGSTSPPPPPLLQGTIKVDQAANPNPNGRASPIVVRVYELRSPAAFSGADFFCLVRQRVRDPRTAIWSGREEYGLNPAETQPYKRQLSPTRSSSEWWQPSGSGAFPLATGGAGSSRATEHNSDWH
jgi:type VI secretion system protein VasD